MSEIKVALILAEYKNIFQPYLSRWAQTVPDENTHMDYFYFGEITVRSPINTTVLGQISRGKKLWNAFVLSIKSPKAFLRFIFDDNGLSLRTAIRLWAEYGVLGIENYRLIHIANSFLFPKFESITKALRIPVVVSFRGHDTYIRPFFSQEWRAVLLRIYEQVSYLHFVSNDMKQFAIKNLGAPEEKCEVIYPGIDLDFFCKESSPAYEVERSELQLITVGRLTWEKDYITALRALRLLLDAGNNVNYSIVGAGDDLSRINFWIRKLALCENVSLLGALLPEQVREALRHADIYIQSSLSEAFGVAVVEAQAMELPVVCAKVGGLPEIVEDGISGLLVPPADPVALANALIRLCNNPVERKKMGQAGRTRVEENFSLDIEIRQWRSLYGTGSIA